MVEGRVSIVRIDASPVTPSQPKARSVITLVSLACVLALAGGCGSASYALRARSAEHALQDVEQAALSKAPYELTLARLYLDKAREEASEAHYALALDLATRAEQNANRARVLAATDRSRAAE